MGGIVIVYLICLLIKLRNYKKIPNQRLDQISETSTHTLNKVSESDCTQLIYAQTDENSPIARLTFIEIDGEPSQRIEFIYKKEMSLGRSKDVDICINDRTVSSRHATFIYKDSKLILEDKGSSNGTFCNDLRITTPQIIDLNQINLIKIGRTKFIIETL